MVKIDVYRHQYGVGQGNFHIQELAFSGLRAPLTHRFVYDCGGYPKAIKWCVEHATTAPERLKVDAVYLSHFENDHVNGLTALCANAQVDRIYAPHIDKAQAAHIVAMQIAKAGAWTIELQSFVSTVAGVASGGPVNGVPVTLIQGGDSPRASALELPSEPLNNVNQDAELSVSAPTGAVASHAERVIVSVPSAGGTHRVELWEIVHWYYARHSDLTAEILAALRAALPDFQTHAVPGLELNASPVLTATTLTWFQKNFKAVAKIYEEVMDLHNAFRVVKGDPPIPKNHNVASLCVYSGPVPIFAELEQYMSRPQPSAYWYSIKPGFYKAPYTDRTHYRSAWLATGDAMLKDRNVWNDFEVHFTTTRLDGCLTVQIPHHGADALSSQNYNPKLIRKHQNCVISAGANSKDRHPHKDVVKDILAKPAVLRLVNENDPMGFIEYLKFQRK